MEPALITRPLSNRRLTARRRPQARARSGRSRRRPTPRLIAALVGLVVVLGAGFLWFRDSSLVAVEHVRVTGASGADAVKVRSALVTAARNMTTLDVDMSQLRTAIQPYPDVKRLDVSTQFPHGMHIHVIEQMPVAVVLEAGRRIAVAGDGTLLHDVVPSSSLPTISLRILPGGPRLTGYALSEVRLLAAAPYQLLSKIGDVSDGATHGLVAQLRDGPSIYFGGASQLSQKWTAAAAVLADTGSAGAVYVDVSDPNRPAAGARSDSSGSSSAGVSGSSADASGSTADAGGSTADAGGSTSGATATNGGL